MKNKTVTQKEGFGAYEEIHKKAREIYTGKAVSVTAAIMGNDFQIAVDGSEVFHGTSQGAREFLAAVRS